MRKLSDDDKKAIVKAACREVAQLLEQDWGDPFKDRIVPSPDGLEDEADDYFFKCIRDLAMEFRKKAK